MTYVNQEDETPEQKKERESRQRIALAQIEAMLQKREELLNECVQIADTHQVSFDAGNDLGTQIYFPENCYEVQEEGQYSGWYSSTC